jgi:hypothetical protein
MTQNQIQLVGYYFVTYPDGTVQVRPQMRREQKRKRRLGREVIDNVAQSETGQLAKTVTMCEPIDLER